MKEIFDSRVKQDRRRSDKLGNRLLRVLLFAIIGLGIGVNYGNNGLLQDRASQLGETDTDLALEHKAPLEIRKSIAEIYTTIREPRGTEGKYKEMKAYGSGEVVLVNKEFNYFLVLTASHVVADDKETLYSVELGLRGKTYTDVSVLDVDLDNDLAVLRVEGTTTAKALKLAKRRPAVGETVWHVANPGQMDRLINKGLVNKYEKGRMIASISAVGGSSGGAVVNLQHELVGVISAVRLTVLPMMPGYEVPVAHPTAYNIVITIEDVRSFLGDLI